MKLLLDQNLSYRLCSILKDLPVSINHVRDFSLDKVKDDEIWKYAAQNDYIIISKDSDFVEKAFVKGFPPKIIWINKGNCSTNTIKNFQRIINFSEDENNALLILY